jgi:uncharacterized protein YdeI (YjbR/CyaY-like superfamily)
MNNIDNLTVVYFESQQSMEAWLSENHAASAGIWLKIAKKDTGIPSVDLRQAQDSAMCYGWVDGQSNPLDDQYWLLRFTPRKPKSRWSKRNCARAEALIADGKMEPAGLAQVERAKADGRWEAAYDPPSTMDVPEDFLAELEKNLPAKEFFRTLNSANRYAVLYRIQTAKKSETRAARIEKMINMLAKNEKIYA